ncbi:hypothetical protein PCASD_15807 [Puccinia coronata f. sp. avenae]|uniref:PWWP domain-containing protein n=1 Tax=Puccinia coronata f. sp. avenae TaxID=200324 RepID=A0A2N5TTY5_9BASI|nr:hypothetical protein PCASD_15807 [Puccinia coronata f. sp. avenae]
MDLSHDPWTNEQIRFQSSAATLDTFSEISIPNQISIRTPGESLVVPGEPVLCKTRAWETNYWPARLVKYEGSSRRQARTQTEELFCVKFCDDVRMVVPRSFFLTAFQKEFKTAKLGELETTEVTWEQILPKLKKETQKLDSIISGSYMEQSVVDRTKTTSPAHLKDTDNWLKAYPTVSIQKPLLQVLRNIFKIDIYFT